MLNWMMAVPNFKSFNLDSLRNIQYGGGPMPSRIIREALDSSLQPHTGLWAN
ncbi:MAG: hypothetical protein CM15mP49_06340 [Actinomycetota bacterium]|nr:MAG: hypothetical protein CM15mP49_06340 [Actinomycetota bacterium]